MAAGRFAEKAKTGKPLKISLWLCGIVCVAALLLSVWLIRLERLSPETLQSGREWACIELTVEAIFLLVFHGQFVRVCFFLEEPLTVRDFWFRKGDCFSAAAGKLVGWMVIALCVRYLVLYGRSFPTIAFSCFTVLLALFYMAAWAAERRWREHHL